MTPRTPSDSTAPRADLRSRARFECLFAGVWLAVGLFLAPALIYWVGILMLGPYGPGTGGEGAGLASFYGDFFGELASFAAHAWAIALGPLVLVSALRLVFLDWRSRESDADARSQDREPRHTEARQPNGGRTGPRREQEARARVEPRIGEG